MIKKSPAPIGGLNYLTADNRLPETDAKVLDNWIPDTGFCRIRESGQDLTGLLLPACQPFACDAIGDVVPTWANGLLEVTSQFDPDIPDFGDVFPLDGLNPINNSGAITDWGGSIVPRALTVNETVPVISPCGIDPVAAVRGTTAVRLQTTENHAFVIYSADGDNAFPTNNTWTVGYSYTTNNFGTQSAAFNIFFRNQGDGTARTEFDTSAIAFALSDPPSEASNFKFAAPAIPFTLGGSDNWYVTFLKVGVGTPFEQVSTVNSTNYWYLPFLVEAKIWNMDGEVSSIIEQINIAQIPNPSSNVIITAFDIDDIEFGMDEVRVAAGSASVSLATANTDDLIIAVLRNRSTYTPPEYCS